jgi:hypothetical protein
MTAVCGVEHSSAFGSFRRDLSVSRTEVCPSVDVSPEKAAEC